MDYSIDFEKICDNYHVIVVVGDEKTDIKTPLTNLADIDELVEAIVEFVEDAQWDVTNMTIQESSEDPALGIIIDMYKGEDDSDPITTTLWYEDYE